MNLRRPTEHLPIRLSRLYCATIYEQRNTFIPEAEKLAAARKRNLDLALSQIQKDFGENAIMRLGDNVKMEVDVIPTGNLLIDRALGVGGFARGRIVEIYGPESSGKTTLTLTAIAQAQKSGGLAAFIDVEHALDPQYAARLGVNLDDLLVSQPSSGEEALQICEALVRSNAIDVIVVDSVAALVTKQELEGEIGDSTVGAQARLMSAALRKLTSFISKARTVCIFTNQIREKIGVMFGNPETTPGGRAPEILRLRTCGHPPHRPDQGQRRRHSREPHQNQGSQKQGGPSLHGMRIRHHVQ